MSEEEGAMGYFRDNHKINVVYDDGQLDQIRPELLGRLIAEYRIDQFERSDGWAEIGIDMIRGMGGPSYEGSERRVN